MSNSVTNVHDSDYLSSLTHCKTKINIKTRILFQEYETFQWIKQKETFIMKYLWKDLLLSIMSDSMDDQSRSRRVSYSSQVDIEFQIAKRKGRDSKVHCSIVQNVDIDL